MKETKKRIIAAVLGVVGGVLAMVGVFSPWVSIYASMPVLGTESIALNGWSFENLAELASLPSQVGLTGAKNAAAGFAVMFILAASILLFSILCLASGALVMVKPRGGGIGLAAFGILTVISAMVSFVLVTLAVGEIQKQMQAVSWLGALISASADISVGIGLYLCIIGGAAAAAGGVVGIRSASSQAAEVEPHNPET